jgi:hypothetical protein
LAVTRAIGQGATAPFSLAVGVHYNKSSTEFNNTTGIGLFVEPSWTLSNRFRVGYRFEPTALAYGVLVLPGGCTEEHPSYPGFPSCREGANYVLNNYLKGAYFLGEPKYGRKGGPYQLYVGLQALVLTHKRYIITSREPGRWRDTHRWVTNAGLGVGIGALLGRFDLAATYNRTGDDFRSHAGFSLGYRFGGQRR